MPPPNELKVILEVAGGTVLDKPPKQGGKDAASALIVVTCETDKKIWAPLSKQPLTTVHEAGHVLTCVMRQRFDKKGGQLRA